METKYYVHPETTRTRVVVEGVICASQKIEDAVTVKAEVDDYITLDDTEISFD